MLKLIDCYCVILRVVVLERGFRWLLNQMPPPPRLMVYQFS
jgi:hypothetical protein